MTKPLFRKAWTSIGVLALCLLGLCRPSIAQTSGAAEMKALRGIFEDQMRKIDEEAVKGLAAWPAAYEKDLGDLAAKAQKAGDLDGLQGARKELERFRKERRIQAADLVSGHPDLRALQERHMAAPAEAEADKSVRIVKLKDMYVERLTALQKKLTMANKLEDALTVNAEVKRVATLQAVTAAEFAVAVREGEKRAKPASGDTTSPEPKTGDKPEASRPPTNAAAGTTPPRPAFTKSIPKGARIYDGEIPAQIPDFTFKTLSVSPTDRLPVGRKVSATVQLAKKSDTTKSTTDSYFYGYERKTIAIQYILRVALRPMSAGATIDGAQLAVQYFSKDTVKGAGKIVPREENLEVIPLPRIDGTRAVTVDCPPVSIISTSSKSRGYFGGSTWSAGQEFYGVVITVFAEDGAIIYQMASNDSLDKAGIPKIPDTFEEDRKAREAAEARRKEFFDSMGRRVIIDP